MTAADQPHRVTWFTPDRPVEGCTINVTPDDTDLVQAEKRARGFAANTVEPTPPEGWSIGRIFRVLLAEYDRRGTALTARDVALRLACEENDRLTAELAAARSSPEAPTPVGPQVFNCDQYPHPPAQCPRCERVGGSS